MRNFLFLFLLLAIPTLLSAQHFEDVVYLKNGSVIRGVIIEQVPNVSIKIQSREGNIFAYRMDEIERFTKEVITGTRNSGNVRNNNVGERPTFNKPRGYMGTIELGSGFVDGTDITNVSLSVVNGYRFLPQFALGLGVGIENFNGYKYTGNSVPIFLHLRSDFLDRKVSPYIVINYGYAVGGIDSTFAEVVLGCSFNIGRGERYRMFAGFGYKNFFDAIYTISPKVGFAW
ncbi:MAG: hypothetical protein LBI15_04725 [Dysgonamonadaceae bacterium]|jgi:hypothetical protein|nr:hypothetical protein [Dysgonamonadaceae bacterium]